VDLAARVVVAVVVAAVVAAVAPELVAELVVAVARVMAAAESQRAPIASLTDVTPRDTR